MSAARDLDARGYGSRELIFHVIVILRQEQELNAQLDFWEKHTDGLALRLGRGYSFTRYKLFAEAAEEYESALISAPDSRYILEDAIQANRLAGRPSRVKELQTRLASQPEAANK